MGDARPFEDCPHAMLNARPHEEKRKNGRMVSADELNRTYGPVRSTQFDEHGPSIRSERLLQIVGGRRVPRRSSGLQRMARPTTLESVGTTDRSSPVWGTAHTGDL